MLVVADADVWTDNLPAAIAAIGDAPWVVPHRVVYRLSESASARYMAGEPDLTDLDQEPYIGRAGGGITIVTRDVWEQVPMDPRFLGWGDEDDAWCYALTTLIGRPLRFTADLIHLWHPPQPRISRGMGSQENRDLIREYLRVARDPEAMAALIAEARAALEVTA